MMPMIRSVLVRHDWQLKRKVLPEAFCSIAVLRCVLEADPPTWAGHALQAGLRPIANAMVSLPRPFEFRLRLRNLIPRHIVLNRLRPVAANQYPCDSLEVLRHRFPVMKLRRGNLHYFVVLAAQLSRIA